MIYAILGKKIVTFSKVSTTSISCTFECITNMHSCILQKFRLIATLWQYYHKNLFGHFSGSILTSLKVS